MIWPRLVMRVIVELTTNYRVASIIKLSGFGVSVVQRLCKTSVKKNLYWEVKDKVIEETYNGVRMDRKPRKVKVYGLDSNKAVRSRLIEILVERVTYHKDKFVAPILHNEMRAMEIKKNGKVEHSDKSHDDQVFSYLMAMYVWYDGKNLMENFGIRKSSIKTDTDIELEQYEIEESLEAREKVDISKANYVADTDIAEDLDWVEKMMANTKTSADLEEEMYLELVKGRMEVLTGSEKLSETVEIETGINPILFNNTNMPGYTQLPPSIFDDDDGLEDKQAVSKNNTPIRGNLADFYDLV